MTSWTNFASRPVRSGAHRSDVSAKYQVSVSLQYKARPWKVDATNWAFPVSVEVGSASSAAAGPPFSSSAFSTVRFR